MNYREVGITVIATVLSGFLVSCSLNPEVLGAERAASNAKAEAVSMNPSVDDFQVIGKLNVDEFNDLATGEDTPRDGGQLVLQVRAEPDSVNAWTDNSLYSSYVTGLIYNSLLRQDPETFEWEGSVAERWTEEDVVVRNDGKELRGEASYAGPGESGDVLLRTPAGDTLRMASSEVQEVRKGVVFTFYLRRGIKFHDGKPLTAADVKFSFDTIKNEYVDAPALRVYYNDLKSCEMLDPYTIRMTYSKQYWMARSFAGGVEVLPEHIYNSDNLLETDPHRIAGKISGMRTWYFAVITVVLLAVTLGLAGLWRNAQAQLRLARKKDDFISAVSHELRTPLTSIRMYAEMLEKNWVKSKDKAADYYRNMRQESERLSRLIENVLDFSRIQRGRKRYDFSLGDINKSVAGVVEMMRPCAAQNGFSIETHLGRLGQTTFDADAVTQIVVNLLDNAVKYARNAEDKTIIVRTKADREFTVIEVEDHGPGVPHRQHKKIFEEFYRIGAESTRETTGTGLGLALVKRFAQAHNGFVEIINARPKGAIFRVALAARMS